MSVIVELSKPHSSEVCSGSLELFLPIFSVLTDGLLVDVASFDGVLFSLLA